jgi:flagellar protein FliS
MPTPKAQADQYLTTRVLTASPAELRLMLLDGALRFCTQGRDGLAARNYEAAFNGFTRTRAIIVELMTTMRSDVGDPALVENLKALYGYMMTRLLSASHEKNLDAADEVLKLLGYERETWVLLMESLASGAGSGAPAAHQGAGAGDAYQAFSVSG